MKEKAVSTFQAASDPALDQLWTSEAHDRLDAYDRGDLDAVTVEDVFEQIAMINE